MCLLQSYSHDYAVIYISLVVIEMYPEQIVTKTFLVSKEAQFYALQDGENSSSILRGELFLQHDESCNGN